MESTLNPDIASLQRMTTSDLRRRYAEVFGDQPPSWNRVWMLRRLAWRLQALAEGGLSERARQRAAELANDADLRMTPPAARPIAPPRCVPLPSLRQQKPTTVCRRPAPS